jgi:hypothetical protein
MKSRALIKPATVVAALGLSSVVLAATCQSLFTLSLQPDGLHKAALANGGFYRTGGISPPKYYMPDLNTLVADSSTIVVATVSKVTAMLEDESRSIKTDYQLDVVQTIKGNIAQTSVVDIPGGKYTFSDDSVAEQFEPVW